MGVADQVFSVQTSDRLLDFLELLIFAERWSKQALRSTEITEFYMIETSSPCAVTRSWQHSHISQDDL